jgi:hypothetical protein
MPISLEPVSQLDHNRIEIFLEGQATPVDPTVSLSSLALCLVKTKSTFEINNLKKRNVTMLHAIWLGEITIRHGQVRARFTDLLSNARSNWKRCHGFGFPYQLSVFECIDQGRSGLVLL